MVAVAEERWSRNGFPRTCYVHRNNQANWLTLSIEGKTLGLSPSRVYDMETGRFLQRDPLPSAAAVVRQVGESGLGIWGYSKFAEEFIRYVYDSKTGLMYHRNRMHEVDPGRSMSRDPIGHGGSEWNLYEYVKGAPGRSLDPYGLVPCEDAWVTRLSVSEFDAKDKLPTERWAQLHKAMASPILQGFENRDMNCAVFFIYAYFRQKRGDPKKYKIFTFIACCEDSCKCPNAGEGEKCYPVQQKRNSASFECKCRHSVKLQPPMGLDDRALLEVGEFGRGPRHKLPIPPPVGPNPDVRDEEF